MSGTYSDPARHTTALDVFVYVPLYKLPILKKSYYCISHRASVDEWDAVSKVIKKMDK